MERKEPNHIYLKLKNLITRPPDCSDDEDLATVTPVNANCAMFMVTHEMGLQWKYQLFLSCGFTRKRQLNLRTCDCWESLRPLNIKIKETKVELKLPIFQDNFG